MKSSYNYKITLLVIFLISNIVLSQNNKNKLKDPKQNRKDTITKYIVQFLPIGFKEAKEKAKKENKLIFLELYTASCYWKGESCYWMYKKYLTDSLVAD